MAEISSVDFAENGRINTHVYFRTVPISRELFNFYGETRVCVNLRTRCDTCRYFLELIREGKQLLQLNCCSGHEYM